MSIIKRALVPALVAGVIPISLGAGCGGGGEPEAEPADSIPSPTTAASPTPTGESLPEVLPGGPSSERLALRPAGSIEGAPLGYVEYLPPGYGDGEPRPLLVYLHGVDAPGVGSEHALQKIFELRVTVPTLIETDYWPEDRPFIVLMPQYGPDAAEDCLLADEVDSFLRFAVDHYAVDATRVYLTGLSCGAIGVWDYLAAHGDEVAAAAVPIAGLAADAFAKAGCALGRVPIWAFHGDADTTPWGSPVESGIARPVRELEACEDPPAVDVRLTIYPGVDHDAWSRTYDFHSAIVPSGGHDIYAWLLRHERT